MVKHVRTCQKYIEQFKQSGIHNYLTTTAPSSIALETASSSTSADDDHLVYIIKATSEGYTLECIVYVGRSTKKKLEQRMYRHLTKGTFKSISGKLFYTVVSERLSSSIAKWMEAACISLFRFYPTKNKNNNRLVNHMMELASLSSEKTLKEQQLIAAAAIRNAISREVSVWTELKLATRKRLSVNHQPGQKRKSDLQASNEQWKKKAHQWELKARNLQEAFEAKGIDPDFVISTLGMSRASTPSTYKSDDSDVASVTDEDESCAVELEEGDYYDE